MKYFFCPVHVTKGPDCSDLCKPARREHQLASDALRKYWTDRGYGRLRTSGELDAEIVSLAHSPGDGHYLSRDKALSRIRKAVDNLESYDKRLGRRMRSAYRKVILSTLKGSARSRAA